MLTIKNTEFSLNNLHNFIENNNASYNIENIYMSIIILVS